MPVPQAGLACLHRFVNKLWRLSQESEGKCINAVQWLEMITFDVLREMAFGEGFECVEKDKAILLYKLHPWIDLIFKHLFEVTLADNRPRRLDAEMPRKDFFTHIANKVLAGEVEQEEMTAHASTLVLAGGETTATCLTAAMYHLLKTPATLEKLTTEILARYKSYGEIDAASVMQLLYLQAVVNEALRIHPPGSQVFRRVSPGCHIDSYWVPKGVCH
ncbi:cytochrome P450 [Pseudomassariella vexata]|uniref:Cytochrome P450 n=1 Tax=Pseudomassariella vexata TaxID=1141098 RepID=A0A1Y2D8Y9_9PEZI|nr:cytochrome P450 [Pseudomassariella vexata]ORY55718.1 cytochrome P450 [Pseudomassariella vexata]